MAKLCNAANHASARGVMIAFDLTVFQFFSNAYEPCLQTEDKNMAQVDLPEPKNIGEWALDLLIVIAAVKISSLFLLAPGVTIGDQPLAVAAVAGIGALSYKLARRWVAFK